ncbi:M23 family metallopeptidase [Natranaerobius thermophilus]|uniref:Peptidase M23 n=1 Tax=Natranaerobius thermophilus (strain ATCC BAA-1301 / DSM 18059 / JW/NM-WN-LF) TaxID=457570 RepID=B2A4A1_NATTJ|nr:M23 family metallopeptidase [Natranaerobius thermophilus]ACB83755.1 Peptidase M23 [Natranaerobius thermophilus JW/NM-WN-LF]
MKPKFVKNTRGSSQKQFRHLFIPILLVGIILTAGWIYLDIDDIQGTNPVAGDNGEKVKDEENKDSEETKDVVSEGDEEEVVNGQKDKEKQETENGKEETDQEDADQSAEIPPSEEWDRDLIVSKLDHFISPIEDAVITYADSHLPGADRAYRNGVHEGIDYFNEYVGVPIEIDTPVKSVAEGEVIRADHDFKELEKSYRDELLEETAELGKTPEDTLDKLRGKQVWVEHEHNIVVRYAHLNSIEAHIEEGYQIEQGEVLGGVGNTGTGAAAEGRDDGPHLHMEIWLGEDQRFLGEEKSIDETREILVEIFE